jgi:NAD(P)-dependent dehydrogenase (short-subunit alcohol dehydrogenase family)
MSLSGQRIVILGGTSGIGLATAQLAAREGASVVIASSNRERVEAALARLPKGNEGHAVDLSRESSISDFFERLGAFDHLAFTAGEPLQLGMVRDTQLTVAQRFFDLRYWGAFSTAKHGARHVRAGGSLVFTSGSASIRPQAGWALGASVCAAMEGLTRALAVELAPIRVNLVAPGIVKTPLWGAISEADREALYRASAAHLPVAHVAEPEEIAQAYLYAMRQTYATGEVLRVDGGNSLV